MTQGWQTHGRSVHDRKRKKAHPRRVQQPSASATTTATAAEPDAPARSAVARSAGSARSATWRNTPNPRTVQGQTIRVEDYQYVYHDLKRIAVLAGGILVVLLALSFILP